MWAGAKTSRPHDIDTSSEEAYDLQVKLRENTPKPFILRHK